MKESHDDDYIRDPSMSFVSRALMEMKGSRGDDGLELPITANVSQRAMISNAISSPRTSQQLTSHHEEKRSFQEYRRLSAPDCLVTPNQGQIQAMYEAQELDITDSEVVGMWLSS